MAVSKSNPAMTVQVERQPIARANGGFLAEFPGNRLREPCRKAGPDQMSGRSKTSLAAFSDDIDDRSLKERVIDVAGWS
jgi:hypothetical protein